MKSGLNVLNSDKVDNYVWRVKRR